MQSMEGVKKVRSTLRSSFTKYSKKIENELCSDSPDQSVLEGQFTILEKKYGELTIKDQVYMENLCINGEEAELEAEQDIIDEYGTVFFTIKSKFELFKKSLLNGANQVGLNANVSDSSSGHSVGVQAARPVPIRRYPETELRKFDGNPKNWLSFWNQFQKIDEDGSLTAGDKFDYLIQSMVPNSKAANLVKNYPPTSENYKNALDALKRRFGRKLLLADVYGRELVGVLTKKSSSGKVPLSDLYDQIQSHLNNLESLGLNADSCEFCSILLCPMVESCIPQDVLKAWDRENRVLAASQSDPTGSSESSEFERGRVRRLLNFLREEVEGDEGILLARGNQGTPEQSSSNSKPRYNKSFNQPPYTATGLLNQNSPKSCVFCEESHKSDACTKSLTLDERYNILKAKNCCFVCLTPGHSVRRCHKYIKCSNCGRRHCTILCSGAGTSLQEPSKTVVPQSANNFVVSENLANITSHPTVLLQTLRVWIRGANGERRLIRALIDTGSQRSYIRKDTAKEMNYISTNDVNIVHVLFGGSKSEVQKHECFSIALTSYDEMYQCTFEALDQPFICDNIPNLVRGPWTTVLQEKGVPLYQLDWSTDQVEVLIGADVAGKLLTGNVIRTGVGPVAVETRLGWSLMGKLPEIDTTHEKTVSALSLSSNPPLSDLWSLDVIGVTDPYEKKTKEELELATKEYFLQTITCDKNGRYEVSMPWLEGHPPISTNFDVASKRLEHVLRKLIRDSLVQDYGQVFKQWLQEGIIEVVDDDDKLGHYLPHRPVVKWSSTTKIRPVFDASAKDLNGVSLNSCLAKGPNLIEDLTSLLLRFRAKACGVIADIAKAFLQVGLKKEDRQFLKFLWRDENGQLVVYRHTRVVFGVTCSPFLLGAVIEYHLKKYLTEDDVCLNNTVETLIKGMYVDNCVVSLENEKEVENFIQSSTKIMSEAKFDLRGWEWTSPTASPSNVTVNLDVLGMRWNRVEDTLSLSETCFKNISFSVVTKRTMLSLAQHVFDPLGLTTGVMLCPKILLQRTWSLKLKWDEEISGDLKKEFCQWCKELPLLLQVQIPRWVFGTHELVNASCHVFCDASKLAYAACIFLHLETAEGVSVRFVRAKSRIAPIKTMSIPRLELMGATIGARLYDATKRDFPSIQNMNTYFWSDSSTVIAWVQRKENWNVFVRNRVNEIRQLTNMERWKHIAGTLNPADVLSRGCSAKEFVNLKWWEGPQWMKTPLDSWPNHGAAPNENEIELERMKSVTSMTIASSRTDWYYRYFSKFNKLINMMAWIKRFIHNCRNPEKRSSTALTVEEIRQAEITVFKLVQGDCFSGENDSRICCLNPFTDEDGVLRVRSKILHRQDARDFLYPVILPARHPVVTSIIEHHHKSSCHAGVQILYGILRERFWILGGRRTIRTTVKQCVVCRRYDGRKMTVPAAPLPEPRVRDAAAFEVSGLDLAGPLHLKEGSKVWILVVTCAVYRAVHFELLSSLSTETFILGLKRFIARRGRPSILYSDNGTNFRGADNQFKELDWEKITDFTNVKRIGWKFIVPAAPWWGGWWEVVVRILKNLLRRVLGRACLTYEELLTLICDCEAVINGRPITFISEEPGLEPITPAMFIQDLREVGVPDCDEVEASRLTKRAVYRKRLQEHLRERFRSEYLGALQHRAQKASRAVQVGEVVLIERDKIKRTEWPLARVLELCPGRDGVVRVAKLISVSGELVRPVQRLIPLEVRASDEEDLTGHLLPEEHTSQVEEVRPEPCLERSGAGDPPQAPSSPPTMSRPRRVVRKPSRYSS